MLSLNSFLMFQFSIPPIDFVGQRIVDNYVKYIIPLSVVLGFVVGFIAQNVFLMLYIIGISLAFCLIAFGLPMPYLTSNYLEWQPAEPEGKRKRNTKKD